MGDRGKMYNNRNNSRGYGRGNGRSNRMAAGAGGMGDRDRNRSNGGRIRRPIALRPVNHAHELLYLDAPVENFYPARPPMVRPPYFNARNDMPGLGENEFDERNHRPLRTFARQLGPDEGIGAGCAAGAACVAGLGCGARPGYGGRAGRGAGPECGPGPAYGPSAAYGAGVACGVGAAYNAEEAYGQAAAEVGGAAAHGARARSPGHGIAFARQIRFPAHGYGVAAILPPPPHRFCVRCHIPLNINMPMNICDACDLIPVLVNPNPLREYIPLRNHHHLRRNEPSPREHHGVQGDVVLPPRGQEYYPPRYYQNRVIVYGEPCYCPQPNLIVDFGIDYEMPTPDAMLRRCIHNVVSALCTTCVPGCFIRPF